MRRKAQVDSLVAYEDDQSYKPASRGEMAAFWSRLYKDGRLPRVVLYLALSLILIVLLTFTIQEAADNVLGPYTFPVFILPLLVLVMFVLYAPTMPRLYRVQFQDKFRRDLLEDELQGLLIEMAGKSLELMALIIVVICLLCIGIFYVAAFLSLPEGTTVVLMAVAVLNAVLISLLLSTLGRANRIYLRKTFDEEEYRRYTRLGNYKVIIGVLVVIDVLAAIYLIFAR